MNRELNDTGRLPRMTDAEVSAYYEHPTEFKELVYDLMNGSLNLDEFPLPDRRICDHIKDEFADGGLCDSLFTGIVEAEHRLNDRLGADDWLGADEDSDVETIMQNYMDICRILCMRMYDYGAEYGK